METIFDHDITPEELMWIFDEEIERDDYMQKYPNDDVRLGHLCLLFHYRGDENWRRYFNQIIDDDLKDRLVTQMQKGSFL